MSAESRCQNSVSYRSDSRRQRHDNNNGDFGRGRLSRYGVFAGRGKSQVGLSPNFSQQNVVFEDMNIFLKVKRNETTRRAFAQVFSATTLAVYTSSTTPGIRVSGCKGKDLEKLLPLQSRQICIVTRCTRIRVYPRPDSLKHLQ